MCRANQIENIAASCRQKEVTPIDAVNQIGVILDNDYAVMTKSESDEPETTWLKECLFGMYFHHKSNHMGAAKNSTMLYRSYEELNT